MGKKEEVFALLKQVKGAWDNTKVLREVLGEAKQPVELAADGFDAAMRQFESDDLLAQDENLRRLQVCTELMYDHCVKLHNRFGAGLDRRRRGQRIEAAFVYYGANYLSEAACRRTARRMAADLDRARQFRQLANPIAVLAATLCGIKFIDIKEVASKFSSLALLDPMATKAIYERTRELKKTVDDIEPIMTPLIRQNLAQADAVARFLKLVGQAESSSRAAKPK